MRKWRCKWNDGWMNLQPAAGWRMKKSAHLAPKGLAPLGPFLHLLRSSSSSSSSNPSIPRAAQNQAGRIQKSQASARTRLYRRTVSTLHQAAQLVAFKNFSTNTPPPQATAPFRITHIHYTINRLLYMYSSRVNASRHPPPLELQTFRKLWKPSSHHSRSNG